MYHLWVYKAEIFCGLWTPIRTSDSTAEAKLKKSVFWDTLTNMHSMDGGIHQGLRNT